MTQSPNEEALDRGLPRQLTIHFCAREDGGLQAFSDHVPEFYLAGHTAVDVLEDVGPVLVRILNDNYGVSVVGFCERDTRPKDGDPSGAPLASSPVPEGNSPDVPAANKSASLTPQNLEEKAREIVGWLNRNWSMDGPSLALELRLLISSALSKAYEDGRLHERKIALEGEPIDLDEAFGAFGA